jgi:hypothetical protein
VFDEAGVADGLYELTLYVEDQPKISDAIFVGGDHDLVDVTVNNALTTPICYVRMSPSEAENWGQDRLGAQEVIAAGDSRVFTLPGSTYDLLLEDCDLNPLAEQYGLDFTTGGTFTAQ